MKTVLLTDDNEDMIELVKLILAKSGYQLATAANGQQAMEYCASTPPDLILMDLKMPDIDGFQVIKRLRDSGLKAPIIVLTGSESDEDRARARAVGANRYIVKTMEMRDLEPAIDSLLHSSGGV